MVSKFLTEVKCRTGIRPITVVTHHDTLKIEDRELALETASAATGSARDHTFFIANYCKEREETNVETELQVFKILHFALQTAERYLKTTGLNSNGQPINLYRESNRYEFNMELVFTSVF